MKFVCKIVQTLYTTCMPILLQILLKKQTQQNSSKLAGRTS